MSASNIHSVYTLSKVYTMDYRSRRIVDNPSSMGNSGVGCSGGTANGSA